MSIKEFLFGKKEKREIPLPPPKKRESSEKFKPVPPHREPSGLPKRMKKRRPKNIQRPIREPLPAPKWERRTSKPKSNRPLFVKLEQYEDAINEIESLKTTIRDVNNGLRDIGGVMRDLDNTVKDWEATIAEFRQGLSRIEEVITQERKTKSPK